MGRRPNNLFRPAFPKHVELCFKFDITPIEANPSVDTLIIVFEGNLIFAVN